MNKEDRVIDMFVVLAIIFTVVLKITGVIKLSWIWLTAVLWVPMLFGIIAIIIMIFMAIIQNFIEKKKEKINERY